MIKLLLVTNLFPNPADPQRGIFTLQLAKALTKFCEVTVICPLPWFPDWKVLARFQRWYNFSKVPTLYKIDGIEVHSPKYILLPKMSESRHAKLMAASLDKTIGQLKKTKCFDLINSQWLYPDSVAADTLALKLGIPHVATGLGCDINRDLLDKKKSDVMISMLQRAKAITVVSSDLKRVLLTQNISASKIYPILNGVDTQHFNLLDPILCRQQLGIDPEQNFLLYVGRLSEEKNLASLIEAFAQSKAIKNNKLYLVGAGELQQQLLEQVVSLGITKSVCFIGSVEHNLVATWMGACKALCLPSIREGCPNVILEALGSGRPVIASQVGAIPDLINKSNGLMFDPLKLESITRAIDSGLAQNWHSKTISDSVSTQTWDCAAQQYFNVFSKVLNDV